MTPVWITRRGQEIVAAIGLLTRLPVPRTEPPPCMAQSAWAWPLIGALLGLVTAVVATTLLQFGVPELICALLVTGLMVLLTGALHEDGLADCADGLPNGSTAAERIRIMRDSRIGAFGTLTLILAIGLRVACIAALLATPSVTAALIIVGSVSRGVMAVAMGWLPPAAPDGVSAAAGQPSPAVCVIGLGLALGLVIWLAGWAWLPVVALAGMPVAGFCLYARRRIGGQTGDVLGAVQILAELSCLVGIIMTG